MTPTEILEKYWGYPSFRDSQVGIVDAVMKGDDILAILATGGGKSICYQVPGLLKEGLTIVISPLISLMEDQVSNLVDRGIKATYLHGGIPRNIEDKLLNDVVEGVYDFLYISPERLNNRLFNYRLHDMHIGLLVIDEAHCISQWGHDFRPAYRNVLSIAENNATIQVVAFTATATAKVTEDISTLLKIQQKNIYKFSTSRENLIYQVVEADNKIDLITEICQKDFNATGIVYVRNRKATVKIAKKLIASGVNAKPYHAGLDYDVKQNTQTEWQQDKVQVVVATNAFGMGIDKPDVRFVIHYELSPTLEEYIQEAGRAGRDGNIAKAILLYNEHDTISKSEMIEKSFPPKEVIYRTYQKLCNHYQIAPGYGEGSTFPFEIADFCRHVRLPLMPTYRSLQILEKSGYIIMSEKFLKPSTVHVNQLLFRDYLNSKPESDDKARVLSQLLRDYDGIYYGYTKISERSLSFTLQKEVEEVIEILTQLSIDEVISYREQNDLGFLTFNYKRPATDQVMISKAAYEDRKSLQIDQLKHMQAYIESKECRQVNIDDYFGFPNSEPCEVCDVCNSRYNVDLEFLEQKVLALFMEKQSVPLLEFKQHWSLMQKKQAFRILKNLVDEKVLIVEHDHIRLRIND